MKRQLLPAFVAGAAILALGTFAALAATSDTTVQPGDALRVHCNGTRASMERVNNSTILVRCATLPPTSTATPTKTATPIPPTATPTKTPTPIPPTATPTKTATPIPPTATATNTPTPIPPTATPTATPTPGGSAAVPMVGGCQVFPSDNPWNTDISNYPVHPNSAAYIAKIDSLTTNQAQKKLHADFGGNGEYGIPYVVVPQNQPMVPITFTAYGDESDPGPYPVPANAPIEGGSGSTGDRHMLVVQQGDCMLYEMYRAFPNGATGGWNAESGAVWDLSSNALRPETWTSADAAGLAILPGLARYDEVAAGAINHALRFTVKTTLRYGYIHPATHWASSSNDPNMPPMGLRLRLRADFDTSGFDGQSRIILEALKKYGMIIADNGSNYYITGDANPGWDDEDLNQLKTVPGTAFEVVNTGPIVYPQQSLQGGR